MTLLKPGDIVSVIAPASQIRSDDRPLLEEGVSLLEDWGLKVRVRVDGTHQFYLAGPDPVRSLHLLDALTDPKTRAIFCTRGGYGSARLIPGLTKASIPGPRALVGHSDITTLHLACGQRWPQVRNIHGPNLATRQLLGDSPECKENRTNLRAALFDTTYEPKLSIDVICPGQARGVLIGGCLSMIVTSLGTSYAPNTSGAILFLEDTGEAPFRIDRMLMHVRLAGLFDQVAGIVFGVMRGCTDQYNDLKAVIADVLADLDLPIGFGLPSGHGDRNLSLPLGSVAVLDCDNGQFSVSGS